MAYQDKQQAQNAKQDHKARPEEQFVPDQRSFGMPNSLMRAAPMTPPPGTPNSVMREMDPEANSGVLFRSRGFDPSLGVHELSHTVRRESVSAPVRLSAPAGTIQRDQTGNNGSGSDMAEYAKKHPELFLLPQRTEAPAAAAAAAAAEPEPEEDSPRQQMDSFISRGQGRISFLYGALDSRDAKWAAKELSKQMQSETDPELLERMTAFRNALTSAMPELSRISARFKGARRKLRSGAALEEIADYLFEANNKLEELTALNKSVGRFRLKPNIFADEHEVREMLSDFEAVEGIEDNFVMVGQGTPGEDYDEPPADSGSSAVSDSQGTPGDYDEPPAAAAPKEEAKLSRFERFKRFLGINRRH